ncbi:acyl-CoA carboxylase epsilon subunit [Agromyces sp. NPDC060279]|uniref:acyl-CoA carboxylase epsilon subunit n=1 Tax=Agromyces sp. NPDC060279 TaxID=3347092 RepID=UPI00364701CC
MTDQDAQPVVDLRFVDRWPMTPAETAAVIAVVTAVLEEHTPEASAPPAGRDEWVRSGAALRRPIETGQGRWQRALR